MTRSESIVIGMGQVGKPLARMIGCEGYDLGDYYILPDADVVNICIPYSDEFVQTVVQYLDYIKPELCIIHSTVLPGTTRKVDESVDCLVAYSPVRGRHPLGEDLHRYVKYVAMNGGWSNAEDYLVEVGFTTATMDKVESLELAKLLETSYTGVLVAWAQEMDRYCKAVGADYWDVVRLFEEQDYLPPVVFQPGHIGGHCIMENLKLLHLVDPHHYFASAAFYSNLETEPNDERLYPLPFDRLRDVKET